MAAHRRAAPPRSEQSARGWRWSTTTRFGRLVDTAQGLDITTIAACHTPVLEDPLIQQAFEQIRSIPSVSPPPLPDQSILDQIIAATAVPEV